MAIKDSGGPFSVISKSFHENHLKVSKINPVTEILYIHFDVGTMLSNIMVRWSFVWTTVSLMNVPLKIHT